MNLFINNFSKFRYNHLNIRSDFFIYLHILYVNISGLSLATKAVTICRCASYTSSSSYVFQQHVYNVANFEIELDRCQFSIFGSNIIADRKYTIPAIIRNLEASVQYADFSIQCLNTDTKAVKADVYCLSVKVITSETLRPITQYCWPLLNIRFTVEDEPLPMKLLSKPKQKKKGCSLSLPWKKDPMKHSWLILDWKMDNTAGVFKDA